jgi:hypothetical protein
LILTKTLDHISAEKWTLGSAVFILLTSGGADEFFWGSLQFDELILSLMGYGGCICANIRAQFTPLAKVTSSQSIPKEEECIKNIRFPGNLSQILE